MKSIGAVPQLVKKVDKVNEYKCHFTFIDQSDKKNWDF